MLKGRLGLDGARIPQADRHGLLWLGRGKLYVQAGTLRFLTAGTDTMKAGDYALPYQQISCILLEPGASVTHDAMRLCSRHGTALIATGEGGSRFYAAALPTGPNSSELARRQAFLWANMPFRIEIIRKMYAWRLGEILPGADLDSLRGIEGARMKVMYQQRAQEFGIDWKGRRYDREKPDAADLPNQAINHAASAIEAPAMIATAITGAIPQLGFIHEDAGIAFPLDIADLYRDSILLPVAFSAVRDYQKKPIEPLERMVRRRAGEVVTKEKLISKMIERIKDLLGPTVEGERP